MFLTNCCCFTSGSYVKWDKCVHNWSISSAGIIRDWVLLFTLWVQKIRAQLSHIMLRVSRPSHDTSETLAVNFWTGWMFKVTPHVCPTLHTSATLWEHFNIFGTNRRVQRLSLCLNSFSQWNANYDNVSTHRSCVKHPELTVFETF